MKKLLALIFAIIFLTLIACTTGIDIIENNESFLYEQEEDLCMEVSNLKFNNAFLVDDLSLFLKDKRASIGDVPLNTDEIKLESLNIINPSQTQDDDKNTKETSVKPEEEPLYYIPEIPLSRELQKFTFEQCKLNNISYELVLSMMYHESKFDTSAIYYNENGSSDSGIMQINSCNLKLLSEKYGITDLQNPYQNITAGINIISGHVHQFGENEGLMAYNMGIGGYQDAIACGIHESSYSQKIMRTKSEFEKLPKI